MILIFFKLLRLVFWLNVWSILENVSDTLEKVCVLLICDIMFFRYV